MKIFLAIILALLSAACSQTGVSRETTEIPLAELDLEPLLLEDGDLPADFKGAQTRHSIEEAPFSELPPAAQAIVQEIDGYNQDTSNLVYILLYEDLDELQEAFEQLVFKSFKFNEEAVPIDGIGEQARFEKDEFAFHYIPYEKVAFTRCNALVYIETSTDTLNYARRLNSRLKASICPRLSLIYFLREFFFFFFYIYIYIYIYLSLSPPPPPPAWREKASLLVQTLNLV